jgi:hypothetical protein
MTIGKKTVFTKHLSHKGFDSRWCKEISVMDNNVKMLIYATFSAHK